MLPQTGFTVPFDSLSKFLSLSLSRHRIPFCAADAKLFGFRYRKECFSLVSLFIPLLLLFHFCNFCVPFTSTFLSPPVVPEMKKVFHPTKPYRNLITHSNRYEGIERWGRENETVSHEESESDICLTHDLIPGPKDTISDFKTQEAALFSFSAPKNLWLRCIDYSWIHRLLFFPSEPCPSSSPPLLFSSLLLVFWMTL